jgi:hypothetical protein
MPQLTELRIEHEAAWTNMRLEALGALPLLRKLTVIGSLEGTPLDRLKQLSQLRELTLERVQSANFLSMCQPPHSLQLESLRTDIEVGEVEMRALLHLPTLTELDPASLAPSAWPLLPQLPRLRRLTIDPEVPGFTSEMTSSLSSSLALCATLDDLALTVLLSVDMLDEEECTCWTALLRSVPNVRRLFVRSVFVEPLLAVLPLHLPRLEQFVLRCWENNHVILEQLAHPTLQEFEFKTLHAFDR